MINGELAKKKELLEELPEVTRWEDLVNSPKNDKTWGRWNH
jgi:hypothetical protein